MKLAHTASNESHQQRNMEELTLALLQLLASQKTWGVGKTIEMVLTEPTLFTLSIEVEALEGNTKTKHTAQFVSNIHQPEF